MDINDPAKFIECDIDNILDITEDVRKLRSFIFRGHREADWDIKSSFNLMFEKYPRTQMIEGAERQSIEFFKKRAKIFGVELSDKDNLADLLCTMQHYGCPTRLVDFTQSFFIAAYFSVREPERNSENYSIWALNYPVLLSRSSKMICDFLGDNDITSAQLMNNLIYNPFDISKPAGIVPIDSLSISKRMSSQQGVLLAPTYIRNSFLENLCQMFEINIESKRIDLKKFREISANMVNNIYVIKFNLKSEYIQSVRRELLSLNITSENLFPDLEGLSKSAVEHLFWQY